MAFHVLMHTNKQAGDYSWYNQQGMFLLFQVRSKASPKQASAGDGPG